MIALEWKAAQKGFFDRKAVLDAVGRARTSVLSRGGAFVRRTARTSIRKRKKPSAPGKPPSSHVGTLRNLLYFAFDFASQSVVVGPTLTTGAAKAMQPVNETVPGILERGGVARKETTRNARGKVVKVRTVRLAARPFMGPALDSNKDKLAAMWENSMKSN